MMKALIVEDEKYIVDGLKKMIPWEQLGFRQLGVAYDGEEGWNHFCQEEPDFLLTDIYMPKMNGLELIKKVRSVGKDIPVIILSGYEEFEYAKEAIDLDVNKYILKPALHTEIIEVIEECVYEWNKKNTYKQYLAEFRDQIDKDLPVLRNEFLSDMVSFGLQTKDISENRLRFLELDSSIISGALVMSLKLHRSNRENTRTEKDWQLLKFAVKNITQEIVHSQNGFVLRYMEDRLQIVLFGVNKDEVVAKAKTMAEQLIMNISNYLDIDINIGIGRWYKHVEQYPLSEKESRDMLLKSDYEGYQKTFYAEDDFYKRPDFDRKLPDYPFQQVRTMFPAFLRRDRNQVMSQWLQIEKLMLEAKHAPVAYLYSICIGILNSLYLYLIENNDSIIGSANFIQTLKNIEQLTTPHELVKWMELQLIDLFNYLERCDQEQRTSGYVEYVKKIVHERYHENISFAEIAKELHLSRNYLSNFFTREVGDSFRNYLTSYRIQKAKELIDTNRYMLYEVSEMVGYSDQNYFSRIFKKFTGVSPTEYKMGVKSVR